MVRNSLAVWLICVLLESSNTSFLGKQFSEYTQRLGCQKTAPFYGKSGVTRLRVRPSRAEVSPVNHGMSRHSRKNVLWREELRCHQTTVLLSEVRIALLVIGTYEGFPHECQTILKELVCLPCDGDIVSLASLSQGTGFRTGVCPQVCSRLHKNCAEAFFYSEMNSATAKKLSVCRPESLICAKLKDISHSPEETCQLFGLNINHKVSRDEDFSLRVLRNLTISEAQMKTESVCHDLGSSFRLYGRSKLMDRKSDAQLLLQVVSLLVTAFWVQMLA